MEKDGRRPAYRLIRPRHPCQRVRRQDAPRGLKRNLVQTCRTSLPSAPRSNRPPRRSLEPIYDVEVLVPDEYMGDVMGDLQTRRAIIMGMEADSGFQKLMAKVPLKEMQRYSTALSSITGGRATFTMNFSGYEKVPAEVQEELLKAYQEQEEDE